MDTLNNTKTNIFTVDELAETFQIGRTTAYEWSKKKFDSELKDGVLYCYLSNKELEDEKIKLEKKKRRAAKNKINPLNNSFSDILDGEIIQDHSDINGINPNSSESIPYHSDGGANDSDSNTNHSVLIEMIKTLNEERTYSKELNTTIVDMTKSISDISNQVRLLEDSDSRTKSDYHQLESKFKTADENLQNAQSHISNIENENNNLRHEIEQKNNLLKELETHLTQQQDVIKKQQSEVDDLKNDQALRIELLKKNDDEISLLQSQIDSQLNTIENITMKYEDKIRDLTNQAETLSDKFLKLKAQLEIERKKPFWKRNVL